MRVLASRSASEFGLQPGIGFFDDSASANAFALSDVLFGGDANAFAVRRGPDGTVLMGIKLFDASVELKQWNRTSRLVGLHTLVEFTLPTIISHEFGHIIQYKRGMTPGGPWQMEPHADFMAGWCLGRTAYKNLSFVPEKVEKAVNSFFKLGDKAFNDKQHHGEPEFRAAMVRIGYESSDLDVNQAFEKGKKFAGMPTA